jgi:hypothetical protein
VCGIWGGYTGEGAKTVLPSKALQKFQPGWYLTRIIKKLPNCLKTTLKDSSKSVKVEVTSLHGGQGYVCPIDFRRIRQQKKHIPMFMVSACTGSFRRQYSNYFHI